MSLHSAPCTGGTPAAIPPSALAGTHDADKARETEATPPQLRANAGGVATSLL